MQFRSFLLFLTLATCSGCSLNDAEHRRREKHTPLGNPEAFAVEYQEGARAVAASLVAIGEKPSEFYADVESKKDGQLLVFHLWHESAFEPRHQNAIGNPGGKCRDVHYDVRKGKATESLLWQ